MPRKISNILVQATALAMLIIGGGLLGAGFQAGTDSDWSELVASMDKMHMAMGAIERSGNADVDFVRLMLPHHQAAIEMAKTQLLYGKDGQMRHFEARAIIKKGDYFT